MRVYGKRLVFHDPRSGVWRAAKPQDQLTLELEFEEVRRESEHEARRMMHRSADHYGKVSRNRNVMSNKWVISGTRIPVSSILSFLDEGYSRAEILKEYPTLVEADIDAAIHFEESERVSA